MRSIVRLLVLYFFFALCPATWAQSIPNPSFEANTFTVFAGSVSGNGPITGWTASPTGLVGLNPAGGSPFANNGATPDGTNVAWLQEVSQLSTTITGLTAGVTYRVSFRANCRAGYAIPFPSCSLNGGAFTSFVAFPAVGGSNAYYTVTKTFTATAATAALVVRNTNATDSALLVDAFSIVVQAPPSITSALSALGSTGSVFAYQITANNNPVSYSATGLPPGLTLNTTTGLISGTPTASGTFDSTIKATNPGGTGNATLSFVIGASIAYTYDNLGRLIKATYPNGPYIVYSYDNASNLSYVYSVLAGPDTNNNGVPDSWEVFYFGGTNVVGQNTTYSVNGLPDFLNYALGVSPAASGRPANYPSTTIASLAGSNYFYTTYTRNKFTTNLVYNIEVSTDLINWFSGPQYTEQTAGPIDNSDGTETVTVRCKTDLATVNSLFIRLSVHTSP